MRAEDARRLLAGAALSVLLFPVCAAGQQEAAAPAAEEAADFARRAALAALHGPQKIFLESIDADGILLHFLGGPIWLGLSSRQQALLRSAAREHFAQALAPVSGATSEVAWASVDRADESAVAVDLGLRYGTEILKTRWAVQHTPRGWTIEDIVLVDPGLSLAEQLTSLLGAQPVRRRDGSREARFQVLPRVLGLTAILAVVLVFGRRMTRERRTILWLTASVPALLFAVDGWLAFRRALSERYVLAEPLPEQPWRPFQTAALEAQRQGRSEEARTAWMKAIAAGAPAAPVYYQMGLTLRARGENGEARQYFERALQGSPPAPGAAKELASIALAERRDADARELLESYLRRTGPDPDSLATLAVVQTNLRDTPAAVETIRAARSLVGEDWKGAELEAQVYARAGNAAATVAALRPLEPRGKLDRSALRADPAYLPIATEEAWVAFLNEMALASTPTPSAH
ncbi:MAG TPA: tetratricopeptide repeat protein [Thermoanaerobaculia bacterium]